MFITMFQKAHLLSLSWSRLIQSMPIHPVPLPATLILLSCLPKSSKWIFLFLPWGSPKVGNLLPFVAAVLCHMLRLVVVCGGGGVLIFLVFLLLLLLFLLLLCLLLLLLLPLSTSPPPLSFSPPTSPSPPSTSPPPPPPPPNLSSTSLASLSGT